MKPRLLDLFCKAGGCTKGYQMAGFYVVGVDIEPQPRYVGDEFHQADALEFVAEHGHEFDVIHASPECQGYSVTKSIWGKEYRKQIEDVRKLLQATGKPYVIENVPGASLIAPVKLTGHHFGLRVIRERWFETHPWMMSPGYVKPASVKTLSARSMSSFSGGATHITVAGHNFKADDARAAMGIDWMTRDELSQAIPPAYTRWIGERLMESLQVSA